MAKDMIPGKPNKIRGGNGDVITWAGLGDGDEGAPTAMIHHRACSIQVEGEFGIGGKCYIEGSNDGANFRVLSDIQGNPLVLYAPCIVQPLQRTIMLRPRVQSKEKTALTVTAVFADEAR